MAHQQTFLITCNTTADYARWLSKVRTDKDAGNTIIDGNEPSKQGGKILVRTELHYQRHRENGAQVEELHDREAIDTLRDGMRMRYLERHVSDLEEQVALLTESNERAVSQAAGYVKELGGLLKKDEQISSMQDVGRYCDSLGEAILELQEAGQLKDDSQYKKENDRLKKELETREEELNDARAECKEAEDKYHKVQQASQQITLVQRNAELEKRIAELETKYNRELAHARDDSEEVKKKLETQNKTLKDILDKNNEIIEARCAEEKRKYADAYDAQTRALRGIQQGYENDIKELKEKLACYKSSEHKSDRKDDCKRDDKHTKGGVLEKEAEQRVNGETEYRKYQGTNPNPRAQTTAALFGYLIYQRIENTDKVKIDAAFERNGIQPSVYGARGTRIYEYAPIGRRLDDVLAELTEGESEWIETTKPRVHEYFSLGKQCGYNPMYWNDGQQLTMLDITLGLRIGEAGAKRRLHGIEKHEGEYFGHDVKPLALDRGKLALRTPEDL